MRLNSLITDMDFRVLPSAIPLQSPSPDKKNGNNITPTISPTAMEIKKNITPIKKQKNQRQYNKSSQNYSTQMKYATHSPGMDYSHALQEKENMIRNLRNVIDVITENGRKNTDQPEDNDLKAEVRILTIQNQKLVNIIDKMSKDKGENSQSTIRLNQKFKKENDQLLRTLKQDRFNHEQEQKQFKKLYKTINMQLRNTEQEKNELEKQNKKLLKILKDKNETEKKITQKSRVSESSQSQILSEKSQKSFEKMTLSKIKEQYNENMKLLRDGLVKQIEETFDTMRIALEGMSGKINSLTQRVSSIQKITWERIHKKSILEEEDQSQDTPIAQLKMEKHHKSQIYIEESPDSEHKRSKQDFDRNLILQAELSKVKQQLSQLRFKYDKICLDTSSINYSQRLKEDNQLEEEISRCKDKLDDKEKEIYLLNEQIKKLQENQSNQDQIAKLNSMHAQQIKQIEENTQLKVKQLTQIFEKQIQLLKNQIIKKNAHLHQSLQQNKSLHFDESKQFYDIIEQLKKDKENLLQENKVLEGKINNDKIEYEINADNWLKQKQILNNRLNEVQDISKTDRSKRENIEQQFLIQMVDLNQNKQKVLNQVQSITKLSEEYKILQNALEQEKAQNLKNSEKLEEMKEQIIKYTKIIEEAEADNLLKQIQAMKQIIESEITIEENNKQNMITNEDLDVQSLKQQIYEKERKCIEQEAKIIELEGICELNRRKIQEFEKVQEHLTQKSKLVENTYQTSKISQIKKKQEILSKISVLKELEQQRSKKLNSLVVSRVQQSFK